MPMPNATRLSLPASAFNVIIISGRDATNTHAPIHTGRLPQLSGTQRHSQVRGRTANQCSRTKNAPDLRSRQSVPTAGLGSEMVQGWA
jgi:hypothetical protein